MCPTSLAAGQSYLSGPPVLILCSHLKGFQGFGFGDGGFQMSFGIGAFPFGIFATAFNINDGRPPPGICVFLLRGLTGFLIRG